MQNADLQLRMVNNGLADVRIKNSSLIRLPSNASIVSTVIKFDTSNVCMALKFCYLLAPSSAVMKTSSTHGKHRK